MSLRTLRGVEKAAILAVALPRDGACALLSRLSRPELERVLDAVQGLGEVPEEVARQVQDEFRQALEHRRHVRQGGFGPARRLARASLGETRSAPLLARIEASGAGVARVLARFRTGYVAERLAEEHPQTAALTLALLPPERASAILSALPEEFGLDVLQRVASLRRVPLSVLRELEDAIEAAFAPAEEVPRELVGLDIAARLLRRAGRGRGTTLLDALHERDPGLADRVRGRLLRFDDLRRLDRRDLQILLREIPIEDLVPALRLASGALRERVFENVSLRAAEHIREELELMGPVRRSEAEALQLRILDVARRLEDEGRIDLEPERSPDALV